MSFLKWLFGPKEEIKESAIEHSSKGEYTSNSNRLEKGGHGEECIEHMKRNNIEFNIVKTYKNGVRVGNVPRHVNKKKQSGIEQSWFPKTWSRETIKRAGQVVSRGQRRQDGVIKEGHYGSVNVGVIRTKGSVATIFPMSIQKDKKGRIIDEYKKTKRINKRKRTNRRTK